MNLIEDVAILTDVSEKTLNKFIPIIDYAICHAIHESQCAHESLTDIDLGYGTLTLKLTNDELWYKFTPSKELEKMILLTLTTHKSPIVNKIENDLQDKIDRAYKELL